MIIIRYHHGYHRVTGRRCDYVRSLLTKNLGHGTGLWVLGSLVACRKYLARQPAREHLSSGWKRPPFLPLRAPCQGSSRGRVFLSLCYASRCRSLLAPRSARRGRAHVVPHHRGQCTYYPGSTQEWWILFELQVASQEMLLLNFHQFYLETKVIFSKSVGQSVNRRILNWKATVLPLSLTSLFDWTR